MSPAALLNDSDYCGSSSCPVELLDRATAEIEQMRNDSNKQSQQQSGAPPSPLINRYHGFPSACLTLLQDTQGNGRCVDCGEQNPQWAAVSYGALLCLNCSGHHRSLGVQVSCVRSIHMDEWSLEHVIAMLEGGNHQLTSFFARHALTSGSCKTVTTKSKRKAINKENVTRLRYKTKAALFYRQQLEMHVRTVLAAGPYRGRETSRTLRRPRTQQQDSVE